MEFSRQEHWSGLPFPSPVDLSDPGIEPGSPGLQADSLPSELQEVPSAKQFWNTIALLQLHELGSLNNQIICEVCFNHKYTCTHSFKTSVASCLSSVQRPRIHSFRMNGKPFILDYQVPTPTPISSPAPSLAHICSSCFSELFLKHTKHTPALEFLHKLFPVHGNSSWRDTALSFRSRLIRHLVTLLKIANSTPTPCTPYLSLILLTFHHST